MLVVSQTFIGLKDFIPVADVKQQLREAKGVGKEEHEQSRDINMACKK